MGVGLLLGCYLVAFAPALALFVRLIAPDPLKIILFVLGAFAWLVSLLLTSAVWMAVYPLREQLWFALSFSIVFQEGARVLTFYLLKKAQKGLGALANPTSAAHVRVTGVMSLANSRHLLAITCGLGMGVMASLFLTMNLFAALANSGVLGLPAAMNVSSSPVQLPSPRLLPLYHALSSMLLSLLHVTWTVMMWDSCHLFSLGGRQWILPGALALATHAISTGTSALSSHGLQPAAIGVKVLLLLFTIGFSYTSIRHESCLELLKELGYALRDWLTLAYARQQLSSCVTRGGRRTTRAATYEAASEQTEEETGRSERTDAEIRNRRPGGGVATTST